LDLSTIEAGKQSLEMEELDTKEILSECAKIVDDKADEKGIELLVNVSKNLPLLFADKRATKQILLNLLSNAVKFTPEGGKVTIEAKSSGREITLSIVDTGGGISETELPYLTDPFHQGGKEPLCGRKGLGVGVNHYQVPD
ncbi:MAG: HAMP domain-containing sensor histidine kinase, partial [Rhodospirillales bacterium]|nr:HAMP domain-containing sensor histidine kinase [Rhodospirillales bacterium]